MNEFINDYFNDIEKQLKAHMYKDYDIMASRVDKLDDVVTEIEKEITK